MSLALPIFFEERSKFVVSPKIRVRENSSFVDKQLSIFYLPSFEISSTWRGASEIIAKFVYEFDKNFSFIRIATPANPNFVACISWKPTSSTIVRYKLWQDVGEILYVPLYNGERIGNEFFIEIWNIKPTTGGTEGVLILEGGDEEGLELELEGDNEGILVFDGSLIGTVSTISHDGTVLFHTSIMNLPTRPYCNSSPILLDDAPDQCVDITFEIGDYVESIADDFIPFDGDYYILDGNCGDTILIKGVRFVGDVIKFQSTDDTWHDVFVGEIQGERILLVDQANTAPGILGSVVVRHISEVFGYRVALALIQGTHVITVDDTPIANFDYNVLYLSYGGVHYGFRVGTVQGEKVLFAPPTGVFI